MAKWNAIAIALLVASAARAQTAPTLGANFVGLSAASLSPPVTPPPAVSGAIGQTQYVECVNGGGTAGDSGACGVYSREGALETTLSVSDIFGSDPDCTGTAIGTIFVLYDAEYNDWLVAQAFQPSPSAGYYCLALAPASESTFTPTIFAFSLPVGATPTGLAVWSSAYFASFNTGPSGQVTGALAVAYDRADMVAGKPIKPPVPKSAPSGQTYLLPAAWTGSKKPPSEAYYLNIGPTADLNLYTFKVDFSEPEKSRFAGPESLGPVPTPACTHPPGGCNLGEQFGTSVLLDVVAGIPMNVTWSELAGTQYLLTNFTSTMTTASVAGPQQSSLVATVYWYSIQNPNASPSIAQSGQIPVTTTPTPSYWMAAIAQDHMGNMAIGFNLTSSAVDPSVYFTGRLATDPMDVMADPVPIVEGSFPQTDSSAWGPYSSITLDPADECTFWYAAEYIAQPPAGTEANWNTWIASLKFPECKAE